MREREKELLCLTYVAKLLQGESIHLPALKIEYSEFWF